VCGRGDSGQHRREPVREVVGVQQLRADLLGPAPVVNEGGGLVQRFQVLQQWGAADEGELYPGQPAGDPSQGVVLNFQLASDELGIHRDADVIHAASTDRCAHQSTTGGAPGAGLWYNWQNSP